MKFIFDATGQNGQGQGQPHNHDVWSYSTVNGSSWLAYDMLPYTTSGGGGTGAEPGRN